MKRIFRMALGGLLLAGALSSSAASPKPAVPAAAPDPAALQGRYEATLRAFRGVAQLDWPTALNMMALPETRLAWSRENGNLFAKPIESAAFFTHAVLLFSGETEERWTGGVYNPALDQWLLLTFVWLKDTREYRLADFAWVPGADAGPDPAALGEADEIGKRFRDRLAKAMPAGEAAARKMTAGTPIGTANDRLAAARQAATRLKAYRTRLRTLLAPDGAPEQAGLRAQVAGLMKLLKTPDPKEKMDAGTKEFFTRIRRDVERPEALFPIFVSQKDNAWVVTFSSPQAPYKLLLATFEGSRDVRLVGTDVRDINPGIGGTP